MIDTLIPVITIDGPSASGKGTIAKLLADHLKWHLLDSGSIYRAFAWGLNQDKLSPENLEFQKVVSHLKIIYSTGFNQKDMQIFYHENLIDNVIRQEVWAQKASRLAVIPQVRKELLPLQRQARRLPGLVADGRDMGSVIFPDALIKFYLDADAENRAQRRFNQLKDQGISVSLDQIREDLLQRDHRDKNRQVSPTQLREDMILIDTTRFSIEEVFRQIVNQVNTMI